jgi:hypothetical protein
LWLAGGCLRWFRDGRADHRSWRRVFFPQRKGDLGDVLLRVLKDEHYRASLAQRSWVAQRQYFSWPAIAARYAEFMRSEK